MTHYMGDSFIKINNSNRTLTPAVIERWEQPDRNTLILKVRGGVKFFNRAPANGRPVEAKDIVYTLKSMTGAQYPDSKLPFPRKDLFFGAKEPVATDSSTVRIDFTSPRSDILYSLAEQRTAVLPEGLREHFGAIDSLNAQLNYQRFVGTGPFIPEKIDPESQMIFAKNPEYWNKPYPYVDRIEYNILKDITALTTALITGQNFYVERVEAPTIDLAKRGLSDVQVVKHQANGSRRLVINTRLKPLDDPRVRTALALLFDKAGFGATFFGKEEWRYPGHLAWTYDEALPQEELGKQPGFRTPTAEDIAEAKRLVNAAGYANGFAVTYLAATDIPGQPRFKEAAEHMKEQAEKYLPGVKINIETITYGTVLARIAKPDGWNLSTGGGSNEISAITMMSVFYHGKGGRNSNGLADPVVDSAIDAAYAEFDTAKRTELLRTAQRQLAKTWPEFHTHHGLAATLVYPTVRGIDLGSNGYAEWYIRQAWLTKS